jgi:[protein-PII] uridylyltransferase
MYRIQHRRAIIDRKSLLGALRGSLNPPRSGTDIRDDCLPILKEAFANGVAEIRDRVDSQGISGTEIVESHAYLIDQLIRSIHDAIVVNEAEEASRTAFQNVSVVATGGYGRGELAPHSDIDLLFITPSGGDARGLRAIETVLYLLWDLGLKVGHATRTVNECISLSKTDLTIRTCLLEARWLWGDQDLFTQFWTRYDSDVIAGSQLQFVDAKLAERRVRHSRMGESRFLLEPHVKEGKGGLRDLHALLWIAKYLYRVDDISTLVDRAIFSTTDVHRFRKAQDFLWTVRCHLHYLAGRPEDRLTFETQTPISKQLGYRDRKGSRGVERFMKHYFHQTKTVGHLTRTLCSVIEDDHKRSRKRVRVPSVSWFRRPPRGFRFDGDRLAFENADVLAMEPLKILELFHHADVHDLQIHPDTVRAVERNNLLINSAFRERPEANALFLELLCSRHDPEKTLGRMNETGVLGRFVPDFGRIVSQMQYDMYHVHTVDEHTIRAIGILSKVEKGELAAKHPTATRLIADIRSRRVLYLAVFLHDIAKGRGGDHSELGAEIALQIGPRLGLDEWETETVSWLVLHHLLMSRFAQKRDIEDPRTIADFIDIVQSPERLRLLLILTSVDIDAVGPHIWNAWKGGLLSELFHRAMDAMDVAPAEGSRRRRNRIAKAKEALAERLSDWAPETRDALISRGYPDYWLAFSTEEHVRHFNLMREVEESGNAFHIRSRPDPARDATEVLVCAPDHPGLFAQIAGAIALSNTTIVNAKVVTLNNGMALDVFYIQDPSGRPVDVSDSLERLTIRVREALTGRLKPAQALKALRDRVVSTRAEAFNVAPAVFFDNHASSTHTLIEVNGRDRVGFLHDVTATLTELGLQISNAHISTYGERVVDVFYVKDVFGLKIEHRAKLDRIEMRLLETMSSESEPTLNAPVTSTIRAAE